MANAVYVVGGEDTEQSCDGGKARFVVGQK